MIDQYAICGKDFRHDQFYTDAHVSQTWKVDARGNFLEELLTDETTVRPNSDYQWTCAICGSGVIMSTRPASDALANYPPPYKLKSNGVYSFIEDGNGEVLAEKNGYDNALPIMVTGLNVLHNQRVQLELLELVREACVGEWMCNHCNTVFPADSFKDPDDSSSFFIPSCSKCHETLAPKEVLLRNRLQKENGDLRNELKAIKAEMAARDVKELEAEMGFPRREVVPVVDEPLPEYPAEMNRLRAVDLHLAQTIVHLFDWNHDRGNVLFSELRDDIDQLRNLIKWGEEQKCQ